jgi:predicted alpha/beta-hydrolase family hydrolase
MASNVALQFDGPKQAATIVALAHGAGASMDSPFMQFSLTKSKFRVVRFNFPYMTAKLETGKGKPPDREPVLRSTWLQVIDTLKSLAAKQAKTRLFIGGKSIGGRIASLVADEADVDGLICLGYPFHPVGKPTQLRTEHLKTVATPTLIVQGERDAFGTKAEIQDLRLAPSIRFAWMKDGDHSFKPRKSSGRTEDENLREAVDAIVGFLDRSAKTPEKNAGP